LNDSIVKLNHRQRAPGNDKCSGFHHRRL